MSKAENKKRTWRLDNISRFVFYIIYNKEYIFYRKYSKLKKVKYNVFFITK
jgi:hypothetical protein